MTTWTHRTLICPASIVVQARNIGDCLHPAASGMFRVTALAIRIGARDPLRIERSDRRPVAASALSDPRDTLYAAAQYGASQQGSRLTATCRLRRAADRWR